MKILNIKIKNLNSLKLEVEVNFEASPFKEVGLFAIVGDTGAGKTTILDAITLALYGKIHRNKEVKEVISYGAGECFAEVIFEVKGEKYLSQWSVWRARGKADGNILGPNRKLSIWNSEEHHFKGIADKIREVDEKVEEITGLDYNRFARSLMLSQGDFAAFLKSGEKERSDLLERITGTEIYSEISKSAYSRFKLEEEKLNNLKQELASLKLLDRETLKELKTDLKEKEALGKQQKLQLDACRTGILFWKDLVKLKDNFNKNKKGLVKIEEEKKAFKLDLKKLEAHKQTTPFQNKIARLDDKELEISILKKEVANLIDSKSKLAESEKEVKSNFEEKEKDFKFLKSSQKEFFKTIEQVIKFDIEISEKLLPLKKEENELKILKNKWKASGEKLHQLKQNQEEISTQFEDSKKWLAENKSLKKLPEEYETIKHLFFEIGGNVKEQKNLNAELTVLEKEVGKLQNEQEKFSQKIEERHAEIQKLELDFKNKLPENYALGRTELIGALNVEIEKMTEIGNYLEDWNRQQTAYQKLIQELNNFNEQLNNLQNQVAILDGEVMTALEFRDAGQRTLEFKKEIWEQQIAIANYEKDRANLQEGEECPLCLSTEHPFRKKEFKPFVDKSKKEFEEAKTDFENREKQFRALLNQQQELNVKIGELRGNELEVVSGRMRRQEEEIEAIENQFSELMGKLKGHDLESLNREKLTEKLAGFSKELKEKKELRKQLSDLNLALENEEKTLQELKEKAQNQALIVQQKTEEQKYKQKKISELSEFSEKNGIKLSNFLTNYSIQFDIEKGNEIFNNLKQKRKLVTENSEKVNELEKQLKILEKELEIEQVRKEDLEKNVQNSEKEIDAEKEKIEKLKARRIEIFGEKNPENERTIFNKNLEEKELALSKLKTRLDELILKIKTTSNSLKEKENQKIKAEKLVEDLKNDLNEKLPKAGFENLEAARNAILPLRMANQIEEKREALNLRNEVLVNENKKLSKDLEEKETQEKNFESLEILNKSFPKLEEAYQNSQQEIGKIKGQLGDHKSRQKESKNLLQNIDSQRVELNRWGALNDLIGSADGKKFRVFAQGLTLKNLVILANKHLQSLNGRYLILKPDDQDLRLDIMDTFQADNTRSMNTLSGGESFLVSLALALGLSDLAGKNTNIRSLFIDEGFGTLDDNSLDLALTTLENLQASGKTIGVISHVKALKERISTQIFVQKKGSGFSQIEILA